MKADPADDNAVSDTIGYLSRRGWISADIERDDLRQEMRIKMWQHPSPFPGYKRRQCRGAAIDYLRRIHGRNKPRIVEFCDMSDRPDVAGGDDPVAWAEVSEAIEQATRPKAARVAAPDPARLGRINMQLPPLSRVTCPPSPWRAVYDALPPGGHGLDLSHEQAKALQAWARSHNLKVSRRKIDGARCGVWRPL